MLITEWFGILFKNHFNLVSNPIEMANQSRRRKYHFFCSPTFVSLISSCNLSEVHLTLVSFGVTPVRILRCFTKAKEMVNRGSRDEKLGAREPYRLKLAIIKTSTERRFKGPFTCRMNSFKSWFHGWNMKGAVSCVPASLNQHPRVRKKKQKVHLHGASPPPKQEKSSFPQYIHVFKKMFC